MKMNEIAVSTTSHTQFVNIDRKVEEAIAEAFGSANQNRSGASEFLAELYALPEEEWPARLRRLVSDQISGILRRAIDPLVPAGLRQKMIETRDNNLEEPPPMPADLSRRLYDYYRDEVERLEGLIGRDLSAWKK